MSKHTNAATVPPSDEWSELEIKEAPKSWKDNPFVPIGLLGGGLALGAVLVLRGRGDGRGLSQRIMEARVATQAVVLAGLVTAGYVLSKSTKREDVYRQSDAPTKAPVIQAPAARVAKAEH